MYYFIISHDVITGLLNKIFICKGTSNYSFQINIEKSTIFALQIYWSRNTELLNILVKVLKDGS